MRVSSRSSQVKPGVCHLVAHLVVHLVVRHLVVRQCVGDRCLSHYLRSSSSIGSHLLWDGVARSCGIGYGRLVMSILSRVNCCRCCCHCHRGHCLRHWVDVAVLVEVLREAFEGDGGEATRGLDKVSVGRGERTQLGTFVDKALKRKGEAGREERGQDQLKISSVFILPIKSI